MNTKKYLQRIHFSGDLTPSLQLLQQLQKQHLLHIPFENLSIHYQQNIELDINQIYQKVVVNHRGGFCYELNGLFYALLQQLGFEVKRISARVFSKEKGYGQEFDHLAVVARIDGIDYLTDVGFGEFTFAPLQITLDIPQKDNRGTFKIEKHDETYLQASQLVEGEWQPQYIFTLLPREYQDYTDMCHYHQTSPLSHFTQNRLCSLATEEGRITVSGNDLKIKTKQETQKLPLKNEQEFEQILWEFFQIKL